MEAPGLFSRPRGPLADQDWDMGEPEDRAARTGQPDTWIMNLAEPSEHRERKPSAFLWGPLWPKEWSLWFVSM